MEPDQRQRRDPRLEIPRLTRLYEKGIFCPAEFWNCVCDVLSCHDSPASHLRALSPQEQQDVYAIYCERPWSLRGKNLIATREAIERWCVEENQD